MYHRQKETLLPSAGWSAGHYANASHKRKLSTAFMASVAWLLLSGVFMAIGYFYCKTLQQKVAVICDSAACIIAKEKNGEIFKHDLLRTSLLRGELVRIGGSGQVVDTSGMKRKDLSMLGYSYAIVYAEQPSDDAAQAQQQQQQQQLQDKQQQQQPPPAAGDGNDVQSDVKEAGAAAAQKEDAAKQEGDDAVKDAAQQQQQQPPPEQPDQPLPQQQEQQQVDAAAPDVAAAAAAAEALGAAGESQQAADQQQQQQQQQPAGQEAAAAGDAAAAAAAGDGNGPQIQDAGAAAEAQQQQPPPGQSGIPPDQGGGGTDGTAAEREALLQKIAELEARIKGQAGAGGGEAAAVGGKQQQQQQQQRRRLMVTQQQVAQLKESLEAVTAEQVERFNAIKDAVKRAKLQQLSLNAAAEDVPIGRGQRRLLIASWDLGSGKARDGLRAFERYLLKYDGHADALLLEERHFWRTLGVCFVIIGALNFVGALLLGSLREPFAKAGKRH